MYVSIYKYKYRLKIHIHYNTCIMYNTVYVCVCFKSNTCIYYVHMYVNFPTLCLLACSIIMHIFSLISIFYIIYDFVCICKNIWNFLYKTYKLKSVCMRVLIMFPTGMINSGESYFFQYILVFKSNSIVH